MSVHLMAAMAVKFRVGVLMRMLKSRGKAMPIKVLRQALDLKVPDFDLDGFLEEHVVLANDENTVDVPTTMRQVSENQDLH